MTDTQTRADEVVPHASQAVALLGIGTATPPGIPQSEAAAMAQEFSCQTDGQRAWLRRVFLRSGVEQRGSVLRNGGADAESRFYGPPGIAGERGPSTSVRMDRYMRDAPILAEKAARIAIEEAGIVAAEITHLITVSCTGFFAPGLDVELVTRLGLRPDLRRMHIGFMGCHAAFNAMAAAQDAVRANSGGAEAVVLVCCVELSTLHFAYGWQPEKLIANALFADGAAACIVGHPTEAGGAGWRLLKTASLLLPKSRDAMTWRVGDHGFEMTLSAELPTLIGAHIRPWCERWLGELGVPLQDVERWAIHPGGPKILTAARDALGLSDDDMRASYDILRQHGNMSSATVFFVLQAVATQKPGWRGDEDAEKRGSGLCVAIGFGPGLMAEGMLLERK